VVAHLTLKHDNACRVLETLEDVLQLCLLFTRMANFTFEGSLKAQVRKQQRLRNAKAFPKATKELGRLSHGSPQELDGRVMPCVCAQVCVWGGKMGIQGRNPYHMSQCHPPANTPSSSVCSVEVGEQLQSVSIALLAGCSRGCGCTQCLAPTFPHLMEAEKSFWVFRTLISNFLLKRATFLYFVLFLCRLIKYLYYLTF